MLSSAVRNRGPRAKPVLLHSGGLGIIPVLTKDNLFGLRMAIGKREGRQAIVAGGNLVTGTVVWVDVKPSVVERTWLLVEHHVGFARVGDITHQKELAPARRKSVLRAGRIQYACVPDETVHGVAAHSGLPAGRSLLIGEKLVGRALVDPR